MTCVKYFVSVVRVDLNLVAQEGEREATLFFFLFLLFYSVFFPSSVKPLVYLLCKIYSRLMPRDTVSQVMRHLLAVMLTNRWSYMSDVNRVSLNPTAV